MVIEKQHKAHVIDIGLPNPGLAHGVQEKHMFVCHETVSYNVKGMADILGLEHVLESEDYWIHGVTDADGHKGWSKGHGNSVFYHAGDVNGVAVGVENISEIPLLIQNKHISHAQAYHMWLDRPAQLHALAVLMACWHHTNPQKHVLKRSTGKIESPGVCSHWDVSRWYKSSGGHWDCWPEDEGGYFPLDHVIDLAKVLVKQGFHF